MGLLSDRLRFSFRRSPPPSPARNPPDPPPEFLCPISGELMADPVIISSGETFDRICIEAFKDLSFNSSSSSLLLIPNSALRSAILRWCDNSGVAHPITLSSEIAVCYARRLLSSSSTSKSVLLSSNTNLQANCSTELPENTSSITYSSSSSDNHSSSSSCSTEIIPVKTHKSVLLSSNTKSQAKCSTELLNESITYSSSSSSSNNHSSSCSTEIIPLKTQKSVLLSSNTKLQANCSTELPNDNSSSITYSSTSSDNHSSSSSSSTEMIPLKTQKSLLLSSSTKPQANCSTELPNENTSSIPSSSFDPLEDKILQKLKNGQIQEQEMALISLLEATRESASRRISLCSTTLLMTLRRLLLSRHPTIQSTALAIIVNLSLEPSNKIPIIRSGSVPSIINLLQSSSKQNATNEATKSCDHNLYCFQKNFSF